MEYKKIILRNTLLALAGIVVGVLLLEMLKINSCNSRFCRYVLVDAVGIPLIFFSLSVLPLSAILYFLREEVFRSWARFAKWYLIASLVLLVLGSNQHGGYISTGLNDRESMTWFLSGLFFVVSLILIAYKSFRLRGGKS